MRASAIQHRIHTFSHMLPDKHTVGHCWPLSQTQTQTSIVGSIPCHFDWLYRPRLVYELISTRNNFWAWDSHVSSVVTFFLCGHPFFWLVIVHFYYFHVDVFVYYPGLCMIALALINPGSKVPINCIISMSRSSSVNFHLADIAYKILQCKTIKAVKFCSIQMRQNCAHRFDWFIAKLQVSARFCFKNNMILFQT